MRMTEYIEVWERLPERLRAVFGVRAFSASEVAELAAAGVPVVGTRWETSPDPMRFHVARAFELWVAARLDTEANAIDHLPEMVRIGAIPLDDPARPDDPPPPSDEDATRAHELRTRARRLRGEDPEFR